MPNLMPDPGYESESHAVTNNTGLAGFVASPVRSGIRALRLRVESAGSPDSCVSPTVTIGDVGVERLFLFYVRPTTTNAAWRLRISHYPDGLADPPVIVYDNASTVFSANAWNIVAVSITPATASDKIVIAPYFAGGAFGSIDWYFDDLTYPGEELVAVAKGMYDAWSGLLAGLKTINGAPGGYWNDFTTPGGGTPRVYGPLLLPGDQSELPSTYLCIPFVDEPEQFTDQQRGVLAEWEQTIFAFIRDAQDNDFSTKAIEDVAKVRDDLVRYLLTNPTLAATVDETILVGSGRTAGIGREHRYGEYQLVVRMRQWIDASSLGPNA